jgi:phosphoglucomutase
MTSIAPENTLRELDEDTRQAWAHYSERLRELSGNEYEHVESESWDELQTELRRLDERREQLSATTTGPGVG